MVLKGYVINLASRSDRLERFKNKVQKYLDCVDIEVFNAIDGKKLDLKDENLRKNVSQWNFKNLNEKTLRGVIACCQSHLECFKKISESNEPYGMIFEDDCCFIKGKELVASKLISEIVYPEKFGIIWLNKWIGYKLENKSQNNMTRITDGYKTMEAYIISKEFAKILYDENITNIGAIDAHIGVLMKKYTDYPCYSYNEDLFIQFDRKDSNIR